MQRLSPKARAAVEEIAGGFAVFAGQNSPVTQAVALGLNGEVNDAAFARLENFYCERNEPPSPGCPVGASGRADRPSCRGRLRSGSVACAARQFVAKKYYPSGFRRAALMNEVHYGLRRRTWKEDLRDARLFECGNIRLWNNSADEHRHVVHAFFA